MRIRTRPARWRPPRASSRNAGSRASRCRLVARASSALALASAAPSAAARMSSLASTSPFFTAWPRSTNGLDDASRGVRREVGLVLAAQVAREPQHARHRLLAHHIGFDVHRRRRHQRRRRRGVFASESTRGRMPRINAKARMWVRFMEVRGDGPRRGPRVPLLKRV